MFSEIDQPIIHVMGDSHSCFFSGRDEISDGYPAVSSELPSIRFYHLGPALAYHLPSLGTSTQGREKLWRNLETYVRSQDWVMLSFGEIDCRAHLLLQAEKQARPVAELAHQCAARYFGVVREIRAMGKQVLVYNAPPSRPRPADYRPEDADKFPMYGTPLERNRVLGQFNSHLQGLCAEHRIPFLSTFDRLIDRQGRTREGYFFDCVHLSQRAMPMTVRRLRALLPGLAIPLPWRYTAGAMAGACGFRPGGVQRWLAKGRNLVEYVHPRHLQAWFRGAPAEERKAIRKGLRWQGSQHRESGE